MRRRDPFRLLVVRLGAMGDILHALPAVAALRRAHPGWQIDWAVEPRWRALLSAEDNSSAEIRSAARPVVDAIFPVPAKAWGKRPLHVETWKAIGALRAQLRAVQYDAVLDLQGSIRSAVVARMTGAQRVVGSARPWEDAARWLYTERVEPVGQHVIEQGCAVASAVAGDLLAPEAPGLPVDFEAEAWCDGYLHGKGIDQGGEPVLLIHPGAGWGAKRWPAARYGALAARFAERGGSVLVNAAPGEEALAAAVIAVSGGRAFAVACTLSQLIALTRRVTAAVGGDTGPLHLACALGKPVVGIYGPTDPKRNGPFGSRFRVLRDPQSRTDHSRHQAPEAGMLSIEPEAVLDALQSLLIQHLTLQDLSQEKRKVHCPESERPEAGVRHG